MIKRLLGFMVTLQKCKTENDTKIFLLACIFAVLKCTPSRGLESYLKNILIANITFNCCSLMVTKSNGRYNGKEQ